MFELELGLIQFPQPIFNSNLFQVNVFLFILHNPSENTNRSLLLIIITFNNPYVNAKCSLFEFIILS
jgi:hypothetical protein